MNVYDATQITIEIGVKSIEAFSSVEFNLMDLVKYIGKRAVMEPFLCVAQFELVEKFGIPSCIHNTTPPVIPEGLAGVVRDFAAMKKKALAESVITAPSNQLRISTNIFCTIAESYVAIRITGGMTAREHDSRWWFAARRGDDLTWKEIDLSYVEVSTGGIITRDDLKFYPSDPAWPHVAWDSTERVAAEYILGRLLNEKDEKSPLTSICKCGHPYKALGLQVGTELRRALRSLRK